MALPEEFLVELRAKTPMASLVGRRVKLARSGREFKGCCPFHGEKTPSFYVYADHFHCFGCAAHGDAISFVMQSQGLPFRDAVEVLAASAGMQVPRDPASEEQHKGRSRVIAVLQAHAAVWHEHLFQEAGLPALDYLRARGLADETVRRFGIGWVGRDVLSMDPALLVDAGLLRVGESGLPEGPLFRNRIIFPIRDRRGQVIAFSGRTMGDGPKYINSPETAVFSKRRVLYGLDEAARMSGARPEPLPLLIVEGQIDAIALMQAGIPAVAPLGSALTAEHIAEAWRIAPVPVICFDGDIPGRAALLRAIDTVLPSLTAHRSVRVCQLPGGLDPADMMADAERAGEMRLLVREAPILSEALFDLLRPEQTTAEARAWLREELEAKAAAIEDKVLSAEYRRALLHRLVAGEPEPPRARGMRARNVDGGIEASRALMAILIRHPGLIDAVHEAWVTMAIPLAHEDLRLHILEAIEGLAEPTPDRLLAALHAMAFPVDAVLSDDPLPLPPCARAGAPEPEAAACWWHLYTRLTAHSLDDEVAAAERAFAACPTDATGQRLLALRMAQLQAA